MALSLRGACDADLPVLQTLYATTRADEAAHSGWPAAFWSGFVAQQFAAQHRHFLTRFADADFLVVMRRGTPMGRLYLCRSMPHWQVIDITLSPVLRGRGVGTALLRWVQRAACRAGGTGVGLHVLHANSGAARLYARLGFVEAVSASSTHRRMLWTCPFS